MLWFPLLALSLLPGGLASAADPGPSLGQQQQQLLHDRLYQTALRGPRWTGNDNQNTLTSLVADSMGLAGLDVDTLDYTLFRWDPQWWSLSIALTNGTTIGVPTTGYWPYSGDSGLKGVTAPVLDAGTFGLLPNQDADPSTLNLTGIPPSGAILFFDNPSPTHNYSEPGYELLGTSRNIPASAIPEVR
ncbi:hypothetical protein C8F04DRAFT_960721 [Mycena alexandri]|uniref:DUF1214 domain-containing protein n=1 Tax=Mycena alexandri TaxID=1745969 RepID=A0AAD6WZM1_9AGAR|nr:hypothetical protein C8F04DRAFT_960721 [Mycena alexandri]